MTTNLCQFFLVFILASGLNPLQAELPREAALILERLQAFEDKIEAQAQAKIAAKRAAVGKVLAQHSTRETRAGNVQTATELKRLSDLMQPQKVAIPNNRLGRDNSSGSLSVKIQIDGRSWMLISKEHLWLSHEDGMGAPAGEHQGSFSTTLGTEEWKPVWSGNVTNRKKLDLPLPVDAEGFELRARLRSGRGSVEVDQQPTAANGYIAKIRMSDVSPDGRKFSGSDWLEFRLTW